MLSLFVYVNVFIFSNSISSNRFSLFLKKISLLNFIYFFIWGKKSNFKDLMHI